MSLITYILINGRLKSVDRIVSLAEVKILERKDFRKSFYLDSPSNFAQASSWQGTSCLSKIRLLQVAHTASFNLSEKLSFDNIYTEIKILMLVQDRGV